LPDDAPEAGEALGAQLDRVDELLVDPTEGPGRGASSVSGSSKKSNSIRSSS